MNNVAEKIMLGLGLGAFTFIILAVVLFLGAFITQWAWNTLMPYVFKLPEINFWQAFAFNLLANCFRSFNTTKS